MTSTDVRSRSPICKVMTGVLVGIAVGAKVAVFVERAVGVFGIDVEVKAGGAVDDGGTAVFVGRGVGVFGMEVKV